jgi:cytochrome c peroxidase
MTKELRLHLLALPLALLGLVVGVLLIWFDPIAIAKQQPTGSIARGSVGTPGPPVPLPVALTAEELEAVRALAPLGDPPDDPTNRSEGNGLAARLGHALFFDPRLSSNGAISCATCHDPYMRFTDGRDIARAIGEGTRNTPTLLNVAHQRWFTWDGRDDSMWAQALEPIEAPLEMGSNRVAIARLIQGDSQYRTAYERVFGTMPPLDQNRIGGPRIPEAARPPRHDVADMNDDPLAEAWLSMRELDRDRIDRVFSNVGKSLAAYQRLLRDDDSPFDGFVRGLSEDGASTTSPLSASEIEGLKLFVGKAGCIRCHNGPMFSDGEFHNIGAPVPDGGPPRDPGRYEGIQLLKRNPFRAAGRFSDAPESSRAVISEALVNSPENWGAFRTPSLRNVAGTAPYMHAGQLATLEDVVEFYSTLKGATQLDHHQAALLEPLNLTQGEKDDLVAFLRTLSGSGPRNEELLRAPSGPLDPILGP